MEKSKLNRSLKRMQHSVTNEHKQITDEAGASQLCVKQNQLVDKATTDPEEISKFVYSYCTLKRNRRANRTKHNRTQSETIEDLITMGNVPIKSDDDSITCEVLNNCDKTSFVTSDDIECLNNAEEDGYELLESSSDDNENFNSNTCGTDLSKESELEELACDENKNLMQEEHKSLELCLNDLDDYLENIDYNFHTITTTIPRTQTQKVLTNTDITKYFTFPKIKSTNDIYLLNCSSSFRDVSKVTSIMDRIYKYDLTPIKMVNSESTENKLMKKRKRSARSFTLPKRAKTQIVPKSLFSRSSFKRATISNVTKYNPNSSWTINDNRTTITTRLCTNECNTLVPTISAAIAATIAPKRNSWLRYSMRKLYPIKIPEPDTETACSRYQPLTIQPTTIIDNTNAYNDTTATTIQQLKTITTNANANTLQSSSHQQHVNENIENNEHDRQQSYNRQSLNNLLPIVSLTQDQGATEGIVTTTTTTRNDLRTARNSVRQSQNRTSQQQYFQSEPSSLRSSRNPSPVSSTSSAASSSGASITEMTLESNNEVTDTSTVQRTPNRGPDNEDSDNEENFEYNDDNKTKFPYILSRPLCTVFCTLGLFNMSRFAIFSIHFGANFLVQFLILSIVFGIPLFMLQIILGYKIKSGMVSMWKISPICKGIGLSLMVSQCITTLYSCVSLCWVLIYLKDCFISPSSKFKWQENVENIRGFHNLTDVQKLPHNVVNYFDGVVLQRLGSGSGMRFQLVLSLSVLWCMVFIVLCRSIQSYGKIVFWLLIMGFTALGAVCSKLLSITNFQTIQNIFPATDWQEFFVNSNSWSTAAQETFLTWGLLGLSVYSLYSYCPASTSRQFNRILLRRECFLIVLLTFLGLFMSAIFGCSAVQILNKKGYVYFPGSFENPKTNIFLWSTENGIPPNIFSLPSKWISRYSTVLGESFRRPFFAHQQSSQQKESGFQVLRLVTEIFPSTLAAAQIKPIWGIIGYLALTIFGLGQLCASWMPIAGAIGKSPSTILLSCITGLFMGFPFLTENGLFIINYIDFIFGGAWWILIVWATYIISIFMIRGRPFTSDILVKNLRLTETLSVFIAFSWNVLLPIALIFLSIMQYRLSHTEELFHNHKRSGSNIYGAHNYLSNWSVRAKQLGGFFQLAFLVLIPCVSIVQIYRYLSNGPPDILDRIELLYRPPIHVMDPSLRHLPNQRLHSNFASNQMSRMTATTSMNVSNNHNDEPPKYEPPPSYSTATGAIFKAALIIRDSIRRSVRRARGEFNRQTRRNNDAIPQDLAHAENIQQNATEINESNITNGRQQQLTTSRSSNIQSFQNATSVDNLVLAEMPMSVHISLNEHNYNNTDSVI